MKLPTTERVFITNNWSGLYTMQVCVVPDATNDEIIKACNDFEKTHSGSHTWSIVIRTPDDAKKAGVTFAAPGVCKECPPRIHMAVR